MRTLLTLTLLLMQTSLHASCISFSPKTTAFENITADGKVSISTRIGNIKTSDTEVLPIYMEIEGTNTQTPSSTLGSGIYTAFLDATFCMTDDSHWRAARPDGRHIDFHSETPMSKKIDKTEIKGGNWKGSIEKGTATIFNSCGDKIRYTKD